MKSEGRVNPGILVDRSKNHLKLLKFALLFFHFFSPLFTLSMLISHRLYTHLQTHCHLQIRFSDDFRDSRIHFKITLN